MNKKWLVIGAACVAVIAIAVVFSLCNAFSGGAGGVVTVYGEAQGFLGPVTVQVALDGSGKIVGLDIAGDQDGVPDIGGPAVVALREEILRKGSIEGVEAVSGATITSNAIFEAISGAISGTRNVASSAERGRPSLEEIQAAGITHGLGFCSVGRSIPRADNLGAIIYSLNVVIAYGLFDNDGRILDLEVDHVEVSTPNYDGPNMPLLIGFPGQSYSGGSEMLTQNYDTFLSQVSGWRTKRERGSSYVMPSGTWEEEMDIFEEAFRGMTVDELQRWFAEYCSDINGKPLSPSSENEADIAKYNALSAEGRAALDAVTGASMSLNDSHGDIIGAIVKAYENRRPVNAEKIAKIGLANLNSATIGYGQDSLGVGNYNFNIMAAGAAYNEDGSMAAVYTDILQVSTPNASGPSFTGFPGQSYSGGSGIVEQTPDSFFEQIETWQTKRERGSSCMMPSGSWAEQMSIFENAFAGMAVEEMNAWFDAYCSDVDGKPLSPSSENEADIAKYNALSAEGRAALDAVTGASMSLRNEYGDLIGLIGKARATAKDTSITVLR